MSSQKVAALYVDPNGVYSGRDDVDVWDEERDARLYAGPYPVVAHPPCHRWARLGRRALRGLDGGCFESALAAVNEYGGVLEHPAQSYAWKRYGLTRPYGPCWQQSLLADAWVAAVDQWHFGFPTRKPTWLLYVGPNPPALPAMLVRATRGCDALWSTEREHTPPAFAELLLGMARSVYPVGVIA